MITVIEPTKSSRKANPGAQTSDDKQRARGVDGNGGGEQRGGGGGGDDHTPQPESERIGVRYKIGLFAALAGVSMMFATLTIPYLSLVGTMMWRPIYLPPLLWLSTGLILASSFTFEAARREWRRGMLASVPSWLMVTMVLGLGFIVSQGYCWAQLATGGAFADSSAHKSFFYILTVLHAAHIVGGIAVIGYLIMRVRRDLRLADAEDEITGGVKRLPRAALEVGALYWHFVDALWVYVFMLLFLWN